MALKLINCLMQRLVGINSECPFPVHFTSRVMNPGKISLNRDRPTLECLAQSSGVYIQANNGIRIGKRLQFGPGVKIISANHLPAARREWEKGPPIEIGDDVWIGANAVILPGVRIPDSCIVGAGAVVTKAIQQRGVVVAGNPAKVVGSVMQRQECVETRV